MTAQPSSQAEREDMAREVLAEVDSAWEPSQGRRWYSEPAAIAAMLAFSDREHATPRSMPEEVVEALATRNRKAGECSNSPDGRHQVDTSMEEGPCNCFHCGVSMKRMVNRFLQWRLPDDFHPDAGISFTPDFNLGTAHPMRHQPRGTNLFTAAQAESMIRHLLATTSSPDSGEAK